MANVKTDKGVLILVDDEDLELIESFKWRLHTKGYACTGSSILMHRLLMNFPEGLVDHKNHNKLDNRKSNLRLSTTSQNCANCKISKNNTSGYKGVTYAPKLNPGYPWMAYIMKNRKRIHIGYFASKELAAAAYNIYADKLFGQFANLNTLENI